MVLGAFRNILCCCGNAGNETEQGMLDETAHLIVPEIVEADDTFSDDILASQRLLRERLTEIVRSKEGKMVNVASQIPFNLHNQLLPKAHSQSSSRSASGSFDPFYDHGYQYYSDFYANNREIARFRKQISKYNHGLGRLRSVSPSNELSGFSQDPLAGPSSARSRSRSPSDGEVTTPAKILNIRLVGYMDTRTRGRARERGPNPSGLPGLQRSVNRGGDQTSIRSDDLGRERSVSTNEDSPTTPLAVNIGSKVPQLQARPPVSYDLHLSDASAMIMTWGD